MTYCCYGYLLSVNGKSLSKICILLSNYLPYGSQAISAEIKRYRDTFFVGCHLNYVHKIEKLMVFLDDILEPYRSDIILKLGMSKT